ncbi:MAG: DUF4158 domain-containing protein [Fischerella sp. CENA71]|nr:DUF4158 domain-containing protein [Fischerella sp. CENA71]
MKNTLVLPKWLDYTTWDSPRWKTAIARKSMSMPMRMAREASVITTATSVLDMGCGRGNDVDFLRQQKIQKGYRSHQRQVQILLGYRRASPLDLLALEQWLLERALEHDKPMLLFEMTCQHLQHNKIVRIGTTRIAKMVSTARQQAQEFIYQTLSPLLSQELCNILDKLLEVDDTLKRTRLSWLQRTPNLICWDCNSRPGFATCQTNSFIAQARFS